MSFRENWRLLSKGERRVICSVLFLMLAIGYPIFLFFFVALPTAFIDDFRPSMNATIAAQIAASERLALEIPDEVDILLVRTSEKHKCRTEWRWEDLKKFTITISADKVVKNSIQHEMYHIARVSRDDFMVGFLADYYIDEPLAVIYEVFGIRLDFWN